MVTLAGPAAADDDTDEHRELVIVPIECAPYWAVPGGDDSPAAWNQVLSFAACVQDASIERIDDPDQLPALVGELTERLAPVMPFYLAALERGPGPIQLRAAYQVGMAHLSLVVRARASIVAPADLSTNPEAAARYHDLHARLEPLLVRSKRIALISFVVVGRVTSVDRRLVTDPVTAHMVRAARDLAALLRRDLPDAPIVEP